MSSESLNQSGAKGPLPLVLGVTGHRDLRKEDYEPLKQQLRAIFHELAESNPFTPFHLISGLAEGADRLAALVALECNISLVACLPMEKSLYETDFKTPESRREFETLLGKAAEAVTLPLAGAGEAQGLQRTAQYHALAKYLTAHSQILIAFWDGVDSKLMGGTSSVVRMQLGAQLDGGDIDPAHPLDLPETGPVFHIVTPRVSNPDPRDKPYQVRKLWHTDPACNSAQASYLRVFSRMDAFNRDAICKGGKLEAARRQSKEWLFPEKIHAGFDASTTSMIDNYALADALAIYYQTFTRRSLRALIFWTGLPVVFLFECFAHCPESIQIWALSFYILIIVLTYGAYQIVKPGQFKTKHLDYRALAEGLRLQIFWRLAGLKDQVADYYLRKQKTELDWIRNAIRVWNAPGGATGSRPEFTLVQAHWIEDQFKFFKKASSRDHHRHQTEKRWTFWILFITIGIAFANLLFSVFLGDQYRALLSCRLWKGGVHDSVDMDLRGLVIIVMALLPAIAGAIAAYSLKMAVREQEKQYLQMRNLFSRGSECLKHALEHKDDLLAARTIFDLGKAALEENGDWVMLHRERSVEVHLGI